MDARYRTLFLKQAQEALKKEPTLDALLKLLQLARPELTKDDVDDKATRESAYRALKLLIHPDKHPASDTSPGQIFQTMQSFYEECCKKIGQSPPNRNKSSSSTMDARNRTLFLEHAQQALKKEPTLDALLKLLQLARPELTKDDVDDKATRESAYRALKLLIHPDKHPASDTTPGQIFQTMQIVYQKCCRKIVQLPPKIVQLPPAPNRNKSASSNPTSVISTLHVPNLASKQQWYEGRALSVRLSSEKLEKFGKTLGRNGLIGAASQNTRFLVRDEKDRAESRWGTLTGVFWEETRNEWRIEVLLRK